MKRTPRAGAPRVEWGTSDDGCGILHADMDAFFASVELLERPELKGMPVIVGGQDRSVVLAATYEARAFGVHSAMPMKRARALCPQAVVLPPSHHKYSDISKKVMEIFRDITPIVEPISVDEAFLDVSGSRRRLGSPRVIGELIRSRIRDELLLPCSVGVATTKFVAKLASGEAKPDGLLVISGESTIRFLHSLPVSALWGVGASTEASLARWGIKTVEQLAHSDVATVCNAVGQAVGRHLHSLAWGEDSRSVTTSREEKSIGSETTFMTDVTQGEVLREKLLALSDSCAMRLRAGGFAGRTIAIKVRSGDFSTISRSRTIDRPADVAGDIYRIAVELLEQCYTEGRPIRLIGIRIEGLVLAADTPYQLSFDEIGPGRREAEVAMDEVRRRFGRKAVRPGTLVEPEQTIENGRRELS